MKFNTEIIGDNLMEDFTGYMRNLLDRDGEYYNSKNIHVSGLDNCPRQAVYSYFDFPKKERNLAEMIQLEFGNIAHALVRRFLNKSEYFEVIQHEQKLTKYLPKGVAGKCDTIAVHNATNSLVLIDVKSVRPNAFKYGNLVKDSYKLQLNAYRYAIARKFKKKLDYLFILILDRSGTNTPRFMEIDIIPDGEMEKIFRKYTFAIDMYKKKKVLPPRVSKYDKKHAWQCGYCSYEGITCKGLTQDNSLEGV